MSVYLSSTNFDPQRSTINHYISSVYEKYGLLGRIVLSLGFLVKELTRRTIVCFACASGFAVKLPPHMRLDELDYHLPRAQDRKSTRLNSSHDQISYAVFCLKKKKKTFINLFFKQKKKKKNTI